MVEFKAFNKISRWNKSDWYITEKIDGTNACIVIDANGGISAQSRNRIITPEQDNFGFATWVESNKEELKTLGEGYHYGEWWGQGIQRRYGLEEKRFSLFRWWQDIPNCCHRVPFLKVNSIDQALDILKTKGSQAAPGFMNPEGIIITHKHYKCSFKIIIGENDNG